MKTFASPFTVSIAALLTVAGLAIATRYPGLINLKFPVAEIVIDGRPVEIVKPTTKLLKSAISKPLATTHDCR